MSSAAMPSPLVELPALRSAFSFLVALGESMEARLASLRGSAAAVNTANETPIDFASMYVGRYIIHAESESELDERIGDALESDWFLTVIRLAAELVTPAAMASADPQVFEGTGRTFRDLHGETAQLLARGFKLMSEWAGATKTFVAQMQPETVQMIVSKIQHTNVVALLHETDTPPRIMLALLAEFEAVAVMLALAELIRRDGPVRCLERPVTHWLASRWITALECHLTFLASMFPAFVSPEVIPFERRYNVEALHEQHARARRGMALMVPQDQLPLSALPMLDDED